MTRGIEVDCLFLLVCFALGVSGALLGAWVFLRSTRAQLEAQRDAFELAREQARRDLQHALLCVPQWVQQTVRIEIEFLGRQQADRHKTQFHEQQRWQSGQDEQRLAEWSALMSASASRPVNKAPVAASRPERPTPAPVPAPVSLSAQPPELMDTPRPQPAPVCAPQESERELSDEEIDALPPDLPAPTRLQGRKLPAPKKPVLRDI